MVREFGYEYESPRSSLGYSDEVLLQKTTSSPLWGALALQSGRDALKVVAREHAPTTVLLPALSCDSMAVPFALYHHSIRYYRLNPDFSIDFDCLESLINCVSSKILFLYMDYFGNPASSVKHLQELKRHYPRLVFIEDKTQVFLHASASHFHPDYTVVSLRKWIDIPDGGLLWSSKPLSHSNFSNDTAFAQRRKAAQDMRREFLETGEQGLKPQFRQIFSTVSELMDCNPLPTRMSEFSFNRVSKPLWESIQDCRRQNSEKLSQILCSNGIELLQKTPGLSDLYVPFLTANRDAVQRALSAEGIFCTIIWPLSQEQRDLCPIAKRTEQFMLAAPCDQRYSSADMEFIGNAIVRTVAKLGGAVA